MGDKSVLIMPGEVTGAQAVLMQQALSRSRGNGSARRGKRRTGKRRATRAKRTAAKSGTRSKKRGSKRFAKGSAAARRHMAKLRAMRRK
jgi:hypothetical protein